MHECPDCGTVWTPKELQAAVRECRVRIWNGYLNTTVMIGCGRQRQGVAEEVARVVREALANYEAPKPVTTGCNLHHDCNDAGPIAMTRCRRRATVERGGKRYCTQHDPELVKRRADERYAKYQEKWRRESLARQRAEGLRVIGMLVVAMRRDGEELPAVLVEMADTLPGETVCTRCGAKAIDHPAKMRGTLTRDGVAEPMTGLCVKPVFEDEQP